MGHSLPALVFELSKRVHGLPFKALAGNLF